MYLTKQLQLSRKVTIYPILTPEDWQLHTSSVKPSELQSAADEMNATLAAYVNSGSTRHRVEDEMERTMKRNHKTGASDKEPRAVLADILDEVYGVVEHR